MNDTSYWISTTRCPQLATRFSLLILVATCTWLAVTTSLAETGDDVSNPARRPKREAIDVGSRKQLFLDGSFFAASRGVHLSVHSPVDAGIAISSDRPWETGGIDAYLTVVPDAAAGHVKLYYTCYVKRPGGDEFNRHHILCCAVSPDGVQWEKPNLGICEFEGSTNNNIIMMAPSETNQSNSKSSPDGADTSAPIQYNYAEFGQVVIDERDIPERRYKMLFMAANPHKIFGAYSADGYRWTVGNDGQPITSAVADSQNVVLWDHTLERWVGYFRYWNATRRVARIETDDFWNWPFLHREDIILAPDPLDTYKKRQDGPVHRSGEYLDKRIRGRRFSPDGPPEKFIWATDNTDHVDGVDFYNQPVFKYPFAEGAYILPFTALYHPSDLMEIQLAVSRDGIHWNRPGDRQPWIRMPLEDDDGTKRMYAAPGVVRRGSKLYHYHSAIEQYHGGSKPGTYEMDYMPDRIGTVRRTELRLDGYVSATAGNLEGSFVTPPIEFVGKRLELNVDTSASGYVLVELLDVYGSNPLGYQLKGFTREDCDRIIANSTRRTVTWNGNTDISPLAGKPIRMHVRMRNARLYAFQFVE